MSETECPTCGDEFKSKRGVKQHHAIIHNKSLSKISKVCDICDSEFKVFECRENAQYCSNECRAIGISGQNNPTYNQVELECNFCEKLYTVIQSNENESKFCSRECQHNWQSENWRGENSPSWNGGIVELECSECGNLFNVAKNKVNERYTCSRRCAGERFSENYNGEDHPAWSGGSRRHHPSGFKWVSFTRMMKSIKQMTCEYCNCSGNYDNLYTHHIEPIGMGGDAWNNKFIVLCKDCHYGNYKYWHPPQLEEYIDQNS
jgi:hypothetical protein